MNSSRKTKTMAIKHGMTYSGDVKLGSIQGFGAETRYFLQDNELTMNILKKTSVTTEGSRREKIDRAGQR